MEPVVLPPGTILNTSLATIACSVRTISRSSIEENGTPEIGPDPVARRDSRTAGITTHISPQWQSRAPKAIVVLHIQSSLIANRTVSARNFLFLLKYLQRKTGVTKQINRQDGIIFFQVNLAPGRPTGRRHQHLDLAAEAPDNSSTNFL